MHRLHLLGLNHTTSPLAVRERLAFAPAARAAAMGAFRQRFPDSEAVLLSTCNRVELYVARAAGDRPTAADFADFVAGFHGVPEAVELRERLREEIIALRQRYNVRELEVM